MSEYNGYIANPDSIRKRDGIYITNCMMCILAECLVTIEERLEVATVASILLKFSEIRRYNETAINSVRLQFVGHEFEPE